MNRILRAICLLCLLMGVGCAPIKPDVRTASPVALPDRYGASIASISRAESMPPHPSNRWWEAFESDELNRLIEDALGRNFDIKAAVARVKQAKAMALKTGAGQSPTLDLESGYTYGKTYHRHDDAASENSRLQFGLAAAYEIDLWGRLSSKTEAARLTALASKEDADTLMITIAATVAENWVDLLAVRHEMTVLQEQIETNRSLVELVELRFFKSMATALDVAQQRETLAATKAEIPLLEAKEKKLLNTLSVLAGSVPGEVTVIQDTLPEPIALPDAGIPADLLLDRPDIRAAAMRLTSADWEVAVAKADRLPILRLSAQSAIETLSSGTLFSSWINTLVAGVTGPLFDGGSSDAEVARARAVAEERIAAYADTVLTAIQEVESMLIDETYQRQYLAGLEAQLAVTRDALIKARIRFLKGQSDYLPFVSELLTTQRLERSLMREKADWIKYRIGLYRALGRGWMNPVNS